MYFIPELEEDNKIVYKGKRFWIVELCGHEDFEFMSKENWDYILYDKLVGCLIATIQKLEGQRMKVFFNGYNAVTYEFDSLKIASKQAPVLMWRYFRELEKGRV